MHFVYVYEKKRENHWFVKLKKHLARLMCMGGGSSTEQAAAVRKAVSGGRNCKRCYAASLKHVLTATVSPLPFVT